jgi:hypothetical protein
MGFWLLVPGVGMGGSGEEVPTPRTIYRPQTAADPAAYRPGAVGGPAAYRPLSATLPPVYRPENATLPSN